MEDNLKERIERTLNIPVLDAIDTLRPPCVTLDIYEENPAVLGDGRAERYSYSVQAIIWTYQKSDRQELKERLRQMIESCYLTPVIRFGSDPDTKLYQAIFDFQMWKENKENEYKKE